MAGLAILCSGQGKQPPGLLKNLRAFPEAQKLESQLSLSPEIDNDELRFRNDVAQILIPLSQLMTYAVLAPKLPKVELFAGYSLGEYTAAALAGVFTPKQLLMITAERGRAMSREAEAIPQTMAGIIGLNRDQIENITAGYGAYVAIVNADDHFVLAAPEAGINDLLTKAEAAGASRAVRLPLNVGSHSPFMDRAADLVAPLLKANAAAPRSKLLAGINGGRVFSAADSAEVLAAQINHTIDFRAVLENTYGYGCRVFLELGPGNALTNMVRSAFPDAEARSVSDFHHLPAAAEWAAAIS